MAQTWAGWLSGLLSSLCERELVPGSHDACLEEARLGALLEKERRKPAGQRDEELIHKRRVDYRRLQLENKRAQMQRYNNAAGRYERSTRECCGAAQWAMRRVAASYRALADFKQQHMQQVTEELAAAVVRRQAVIAAQPTLCLVLPKSLQQVPPRLDMCSRCARLVEKMERAEESHRLEADYMQVNFRQRGLPAAPDAAAASTGARGGAAPALAQATGPAAAAAAEPPAGEALRGQQPPSWQQQQQHCGDNSGADGAERVPTTPRQPPPPQQRHSSSEEERR